MLVLIIAIVITIINAANFYKFIPILPDIAFTK